MQITSTVSQTKMEPINGNLNAAAATEPITVEAADQVGGAFCHQFYITVSENRVNLPKFYGHESIFQLDDQVVTGATEIAKQYNQLEKTHFKIHSIKGLPTFHKQGVLVHVIGTANLRPFVQTFVLGQQGQKKYYVEIDNFQYIDNYFDNKPESENKPVASSSTAVNGHSNGVNGKVTKPVAKAEQPAEPQQQSKTPQKAQQTPKKAEEQRPVKQETPKSVEKENKAPKPQHHQQPQQQHQAPAPAPIQEQAPAPAPVQEPPKPKTWANLVSRGNPQQQPQGAFNQLHQQHLHQQHQQQMQAAALHQHQQAQVHAAYQAQRAQQQHAQAAAVAAVQQQHQPSADLHHGEDNANLLERKIYLGGITREIVPSNTAQAETEIKQVFHKYGEVEEVRMPRKVLDSPNDTSKHAFAFITMRNKQGVQAIFAGATRDDQGNWKLPLKLDAFGFDGFAQISEQRDQPGGGFRGGRGGGGGFGNRGGYFRRGGPGGAPRGGMRGGFQNNSLNGGH